MQHYTIYHSVNQWLPKSAGWIFEQIQLFNFEDQCVLADILSSNPPLNLPFFVRKNDLKTRFWGYNFRNALLKKSKDKRKILFSHFGHRAWQDLPLVVDKRVARFYGFDLHRLPFENKIWLERYAQLFEKTDLILTEGPYMKGELLKMGCKENIVKVLPIGVHISENWKVRSTEKTFNILIAGRFTEKKGIDTALLACQDFIEKSQNLALKIHLIGDGLENNINENNYVQKIKVLAEKSIFKNKIIRYGFVTKNSLKEIALQCQVALLPSQWAANRDCEGGFPVTFLELMETGLPIISTNHCDIPFAINENNGIICQEKDIEALSKSLALFLDPHFLQEKSKNARETVVNRFDWEKLKPLYHQAILL